PSPNSPRHGFLLSNGQYTSLDVPAAMSTVAFGISNAGQIVGWYEDAMAGAHGFLRSTADTYDSLDFPGSSLTEATAINNAGQILGIYGSSYSFLLQGGNYSTLMVPGSTQTSAWGINDA